ENILSCGLTNYGHPLGLAALSGVFKIIDDPSFHLRLKENIEIFNQALEDIAKLSCVKEVRKIGLLGIIEHSKTISFEAYRAEGLFVYNHPHDAILAPAMTMEPKELELGFKKLKKVING